MSEIDWNRMLRIEFIFYSLMATVMVLQSTVDCISEEGIPELITRRQTGDVYRYYTNSEVLFLCGEGTNLTYLVHERQCVDEEQLLNDCSFSITPNEEFSNFEVALTIADRLGTTLLMSPVTVNSRNDAADAVVVYRGSNHPVNGSLCVISNLEVYRGRGQITEIESGGFSLNERGFIQTDNASLVYNIEEYLGELYRMRFSCSGEGLPESGCLFFKVIGTTNVTSAKFSDSVPGTIYGREEEDAPTTTVLISTESTTDGDTFTGTSQQPTLLPTGQIPESNTTSGPGGIDNGTLMYIIYAVAVVGVVTLLVVVILLCAVIAFLCCSSSNKNKKKREPVNVTASAYLQSETFDMTATAPKDIPITQQELSPPPEWDQNPAYNIRSTSWTEGSNL